MNNFNFATNEELTEKLDKIFAALPQDEQHALIQISSSLYSSSEGESSPGLKNSLILLANICSCALNLDSKNDPFLPELSTKDRRSFLPIDLSQDEFSYLAEVVGGIHQNIIKSRIADILWIYGSPRNKNYLDMAINSYISLNIDNDFPKQDIYASWERAAVLSVSTKTLTSKVKYKLLKEIVNSSRNLDFHLLRIIEIFSKTDLSRNLHHRFAERLLERQKEFNHQEQFNVVEGYLKLARDLFKKIGDNSKMYECIYFLAQATEGHANFRELDSHMVAKHFYELSLQTYREIPGNYREQFNASEKLISIQEKINKLGPLVINELQLSSTKEHDISELQFQSMNHVKDKKTPFESLVYFSEIISVSYKNILKQTEENIKNSLIGNICNVTSMSQDGRKIAVIPVLNDKNKDEVILKTSIRDFIVWMQLYVNGLILPALCQIQKEYVFPKEFLIELCKQSPVVPDKREILVANALYHGFEGDFRTSVHLLAPQVENMIRQRLKKNGVITTHIDNKDGIEQEVGLSTLVATDGAKDILGEDLWFELQAVFTSSLSANLRNEVGHGLLDDDTSNTAYSIYAWWMVLRLVVKSILKDTDTSSETSDSVHSSSD